MNGSPLQGLKIVVTRPRHQADAFARLLRAAGAQPVLFPAIAVQSLADTTILDRALARLACFDWLILTSVNGVQAVWERLDALGISRLPASLRLAAIGPKTEAALRARGAAPDFVPDEYVAEAITPGLGDLRGAWALLPRADIARPALSDAIREEGGFPHDVVAYTTVAAEPAKEALEVLRTGVDVLTFTSSSTVRYFLALAEAYAIDSERPVTACIGPITANTAREHGLTVEVVAQDYTIEGLAAALSAYFEKKNQTVGL